MPMVKDATKKDAPETAKFLVYSSLSQIFELNGYSWIFIREA